MSRWGRTLSACALALAILPVPGCGSSCVPTELTMDPVTITDLDAPLTLQARLTRDGAPFPGAEVRLQLDTEGSHNRSGDAGQTVTTDANGVATLHRPDGVAGMTLSSDRVVGASTYFQPLGEIDGREHCWSRAAARFDCPIGGGSGACPTRDPFAPPSG